ncbi:MAG: outer membrane lipoprotein chaperone LolA [Gammaproteobacteria bacterium]|nr:outer membrane lipoprotein chaperone LolA [Gammaproteobacteria bacterium]TVQ49847.1 MAG: outer membrane lipoprotein carrier protein LolA [Gammaproteobacteria bacterium]
MQSRLLWPAALAMALALAWWPGAGHGETAPGDPQHLAVAAERLDALLEATDTLRARFEQRVYDGSGRVLDEARGEVEIARPGRFRWAYAAPYEQLLVTDGEQVWMYDVDLEQVSVSRVEQAIAGSPAMLLGGGRLAEGFDIIDSWAGEGLEWVALVPRQLDSDFRRIALGHDGTLIRRMELTDALGQRTLVVFADIESGIELPAERFVFIAPDGVDVIGPDGR